MVEQEVVQAQAPMGDLGPLQEDEQLPERGQVGVAECFRLYLSQGRAFSRTVGQDRSKRSYLRGGQQFGRHDTSPCHSHCHQSMVLDRAAHGQGWTACGRPAQAQPAQEAPACSRPERVAVQDSNVQ